MKRYQLLVLTSGLLLGACEKNKVELPASQAKPAAAAPAPAAAPVDAGGAQAATQPPVQAAAAGAMTPAMVNNNTAAAAAQNQAAPATNDTTNTRLSGEVASQLKSQLSFRTGGFIQELKAKTGITCKKGDVLAVLDQRDYRLALDMARSQKEMARVSLTNAQSEFNREEQLKKENVSTESMYDQRKAAFDNARLNLQMAELKLTQAEQAMQDTKLVAPYDCVVTKQMRNVGESVKPGDAVFELYNTSDVELNFSVPERLAGKIKVGDKLKVSIPATGFAGNLEVIRLIPVVEQASRSFHVIAKAPDQDQRVVPGLYAEAQLQ